MGEHLVCVMSLLILHIYMILFNKIKSIQHISFRFSYKSHAIFNRNVTVSEK